MTKEEKLIKLVKIAVENGFEFTMKVYQAGEFNDFGQLLWADYNCLFSHDFARAIWGDALAVCDQCFASNSKDCFCDVPNLGVITKWIFHIQQAVISEDPLQYYWENK